MSLPKATSGIGWAGIRNAFVLMCVRLNFFMASAPGHPFWAFAVRLLPERRSKPVMSATGPWFLNAAC